MFTLILQFLVKSISGIAFVLYTYIVFLWILSGNKEIAALLTIAVSDLYFGRFAK